MNDNANTVSSDASFNLFNWHRNNEGGLWLTEGFEDIDTVRRNNSHPWIKNDSDEDIISEGEESVIMDVKGIQEWRKGIAA